jgi:hypothetical protein
MRRIAVILGLCTLLLPTAAWADGIGLVNRFGSVSITNAGIVSRGSELIGFNGITAPPGHSLGSVSFSTGALTSGSIWSGGTFSSAGSSFVVISVGKYGQPKGTIFDASFVGPIKWKLVSHPGKWDYVFMLSGVVSGEITGVASVSAVPTSASAYLNPARWDYSARA